MEGMVRLRWSGNSSRKYDGRIEDVPVRCVFPEDLPLTVGKNVRVLLDCGAGERVWSGTVVEEKKPPSALQLALSEKRSAHCGQAKDDTTQSSADSNTALPPEAVVPPTTVPTTIPFTSSPPSPASSSTCPVLAVVPPPTSSPSAPSSATWPTVGLTDPSASTSAFHPPFTSSPIAHSSDDEFTAPPPLKKRATVDVETSAGRGKGKGKGKSKGKSRALPPDEIPAGKRRKGGKGGKGGKPATGTVLNVHSTGVDDDHTLLGLLHSLVKGQAELLEAFKTSHPPAGQEEIGEQRQIRERQEIGEQRQIRERQEIGEQRQIRERQEIGEQRQIRERQERERQEIGEQRQERERQEIGEQRQIRERQEIGEQRQIRERQERERQEIGEQRQIRERQEIGEQRQIRERQERERQEIGEQRQIRERQEIGEQRQIRERQEIGEQRQIREIGEQRPQQPAYAFLLTDEEEEEMRASIADLNNEDRILLDSISSCPESPPSTHFPIPFPSLYNPSSTHTLSHHSSDLHDANYTPNQRNAPMPSYPPTQHNAPSALSASLYPPTQHNAPSALSYPPTQHNAPLAPSYPPTQHYNTLSALPATFYPPSQRNTPSAPSHPAIQQHNYQASKQNNQPSTSYQADQLPTYNTPPRPMGHQRSPQHFTPMKDKHDILRRYRDERHAGRLAVQLAQFYYFGTETMRSNTAGTLDQGKMLFIKDAILSKFPTRCRQDKEAMWERCKKAIGQKCNHLRYGK